MYTDTTDGNVVPAIAGIPETMLWTLYSRVAESRRANGLLRDPVAVRILERIDYDFVGRFDQAQRTFALRAMRMDEALRRWIARHPDGTVVSLGEGLETQFSRVDNGRITWISVDLPEAIRLRETFIAPGGRLVHQACSASDPAWLQAVGQPTALFVIAQGLLMYLRPDEVRDILRMVGARFPETTMVFDVVSRAMSRETCRGMHLSNGYSLPPMPWGEDRDRIASTLRSWGLPVRSLHFLPYNIHHSRHPVLERLLDAILPSRQRRETIVHLILRGGGEQPP
jgi:O-methyltransferase involved in polyketide biosynthesis